MTTVNWNVFFRLTRGMAAEMLGDHSDRQLVERALTGPDAAALAAIVHRHGPMVYRVCWRVLHHAHDAEDAFQATFLVLARKLRTLRKHPSLASWLHGVALRVARKARAQAAARRRREHRASRPDALPPEDVTWQELRGALDGELGRLPDRWRLPLLLCYLEGRTQEEAARHLGWSKSTLRRRLEEARTALGCRLTRRGLVWPAALTAVLISDCLTAAPAPGLVAATVDVAAGLVAGKSLALATSARVATLAEGVLKPMFLTKLKVAMAVLLCMSFVTAGMGGFSAPTRAPEQVEDRPEVPPKEKKAAPEEVQGARLLVEKAQELEAAKARVRQAEAALQEAQKKLSAAQQHYDDAQDRYEAAKARGQSGEGTTLRGVLVKVDPAAGTVRLEHWKDVPGDGRPFNGIHYLAYEDFPVAKDAVLQQDNVKTKLADLRTGKRTALHLRGNEVRGITVDGGVVPARYVSANAARHTIAVIAGKNDERATYHLLKETEVVGRTGQAVRLGDLRAGMRLLLTRSVEDAHTVIRIEILSAEKEGEE
jgi:RNA polymerase sigma factor (sigma-70 family)